LRKGRNSKGRKRNAESKKRSKNKEKRKGKTLGTATYLVTVKNNIVYSI